MSPSPSPSPTPSGDPPAPNGIDARHAPSPPVLDGRLDDDAWRGATPIAITLDWRGTPTRLVTTARVAWDDDALYFSFDCGYDELVVDEAAPVETELPTLYEHDAVEVFLDPDPATPATYVELEVGPRGHFLDVDVDRGRRPRGNVSWTSGMTVATHVDEAARRYVVEARVPARAFGLLRLGGSASWRVGLYRLAGRGAGRLYLARFPTMTERPSFHVPDRFGTLALRRD